MHKKHSTTIALVTIILSLGIFSFMNKRSHKQTLTLGLASIKQQCVVYDSPHNKANKLWRLNHKNWPITILAISKNWVKISDFHQTVGWIKKHNIGAPYALVIEEAYAYKNWKDENSKMAKLLPNASVRFIKCINEKWCCVNIAGKRVFVEQDKLKY